MEEHLEVFEEDVAVVASQLDHRLLAQLPAADSGQAAEHRPAELVGSVDRHAPALDYSTHVEEHSAARSHSEAVAEFAVLVVRASRAVELERHPAVHFARFGALAMGPVPQWLGLGLGLGLLDLPDND